MHGFWALCLQITRMSVVHTAKLYGGTTVPVLQGQRRFDQDDIQYPRKTEMWLMCQTDLTQWYSVLMSQLTSVGGGAQFEVSSQVVPLPRLKVIERLSIFDFSLISFLSSCFIFASIGAWPDNDIP